MSAIPPPWPAVLRACLLLAALAGCAQSQPTRYYTLSTVTEPAAAPRPGQGLVIGLGPLTLPQYLDRPDIVTRAGANQMRLGDFSQWAEPLEPLLTRIMAEDLYALTGAKDVIPIPQRGDLPLDRVVEVHLTRFDANEAGEVKLNARWRVYRGRQQDPGRQRPVAGRRAGCRGAGLRRHRRRDEPGAGAAQRRDRGRHRRQAAARADPQILIQPQRNEPRTADVRLTGSSW